LVLVLEQVTLQQVNHIFKAPCCIVALLNFCTDQSCDKFSSSLERGHFHLFCPSRWYSRGWHEVFQKKFSFLSYSFWK